MFKFETLKGIYVFKNPTSYYPNCITFLTFFLADFSVKKKNLIHHDQIIDRDQEAISALWLHTWPGKMWMAVWRGLSDCYYGNKSRKYLFSYLAECLPVYFHGTNDYVEALTDYISPRTTSESRRNILMILIKIYLWFGVKFWKLFSSRHSKY